jgi:hypothetical protein
MRSHKKHGLLMAGVNGYKIYILNEKTLRVVARYQHKDVSEKTTEWQTVIDFVNIKYQDINKKEKVISDFLDFTQGMI